MVRAGNHAATLAQAATQQPANMITQHTLMMALAKNVLTFYIQNIKLY